VAANEIPVQHCFRRTILRLKHGFNYSFQQSYVAIDANLQKAIGKAGPFAQQMKRFLRMFESQQPHFGQRVDIAPVTDPSLRLVRCSSACLRSRHLRRSISSEDCCMFVIPGWLLRSMPKAGLLTRIDIKSE
jgi:hypothetical protein